MKHNLLIKIICPVLIIGVVGIVTASEDMPVSAPISSDFAGQGGYAALHSIFRVLCPNSGAAGTGFLHKSGKIITAAHVVDNCTNGIIVGNDNKSIKIKTIDADREIDLALLSLDKTIEKTGYIIGSNDNLAIGLQVSTWGYPNGYYGLAPILSVGYLSGVEHSRTNTGKLLRKRIVNAAFNLGNSGGPLINIETGDVIGVVASKLAPVPPEIETALEALSNANYGLMFTATHPDGKKEQISEAQVVARVLYHLRSQVQLVVGHAVIIGDIRNFLKSRGIEP